MPHRRRFAVGLGLALAGAWLLLAGDGLSNAHAAPLSPADELASFRLADAGLTVELVAAEPDIVSPVAVAWDANGRMFVAEMRDYPNASTGGQVKLLVDSDHDGHFERVTVFADALPFPNGVLPWNGGVLVTAAPDLWFLKDTDGDGRADERRVLFTGFATGNQQLRANGLVWGLDNWIYGANGRSDGEVRPAGHPEAKPWSLRGHDFRFRPATSEFEIVAGRSQFGSGRDDWGNRFLSWNTIPIRHEVLPERALSRNPGLAATDCLQDLLEPGDDGRVFPLTPPPLTFNDESTSHFNALAGLCIFRGDALGAAYVGNAFVGESLRNLVHRRVLEASGPTFVARRGEQGREFLAASDPWFHPVNFATGPDGALYVVDFYRQFVEHPDYVRGKARQEVPWRTGAEHGRLWRVRRQPLPPKTVELESASATTWLRALEHSNGWWRDTAQRLLVEHPDQTVAGRLKQIARQSPRAEARVQALYILQEWGALDGATSRAALRDQSPRVRQNAIRLSAQRNSQELPPLATRLANDSDARVRLELALALGELGPAVRQDPLATLASRDATNRWHTLAILSSLSTGSSSFLQALLEKERRWLSEPGAASSSHGFLEQLARLAGASATEPELQTLLRLTAQEPSTDASEKIGGRLAIFAGLVEGLSRTTNSFRDRLLGSQPLPEGPLLESSGALVALSDLALRTAAKESAALNDRLAAIRVLQRAPASIAAKVLTNLWIPKQPPEVQRAAVRALTDLGDDTLLRCALAQWPQQTRATRREMAGVATRSAAGREALLHALETGAVQPVELEAPTRQTLLKASDPEQRSRAEKLLQSSGATDRVEIVRQFQAALELPGDRRRGALWFSRSCLVCHALQGQGQAIGPDLAGLGSRPKETILIDILDPSRQVPPEYVSYSLLTVDGEQLSGLIAAESATSITIRRSGQPDETLLRNRLQSIRAEGKSLMPDGLEQGMTAQDLADLLEFLRQPEPSLLPKG